MIAPVSILSEPNKLAPVNKELWYRVISGSASSFNDWKYMFDVWTLSPSTGNNQTFVGRFKVPPRPDNLNGWFSPNKALKTYISNIGPDVLYPTTTTIQYENELYVRYSTYVGFEVNPNIFYDDFVNVPSFGIATLIDYGPQINDIITINKTLNTVNPQYNGDFIVTTFSSGTVSMAGLTQAAGYYFIGLSGSFGQSTPAYTDGGYIVNISRMGTTASKLFGYDGTRQYTELNTDFTPIHMISGTATPANFMTNYVGFKPIKLNEYETHNVMYDRSLLGVTNIQIVLELFDSNFGLITTTQSSNINIPSNNHYLFAPTGTANLEGIFGTSIFNGVSFYEVKITSINGDYTFPTKFKILNGCSIYNNVRIIFLNRSGGYSYWTFDKDNQRTVDITRSEYKKVLQPNYLIGERGQTTLAQDVQYTYSLNSDWISEYDYAFLEELITSEDIYILESNGDLTPINITDTSYVIKTQLRDKLFNLTINYKLSYSINVAGQ